MELAPGSSIGRYVVRRKIAEGGMAEIYLATHRGAEGFEREVAIKRVRGFLASDPEFVEMFKAEARIAARLSHPNIVQVFDFDLAGETYYLAMEYVNGRSLSDIRARARERGKPLAPLMALAIAHEVAKGLGHAHRMREPLAPTGVVHRDVTPHNVLVSYAGDVKLTDFGIAKAGTRATAPGVLKGKFAYMSPEQARGDTVDVRTDVFALGIISWEALTGGRLFEGDSDVQVLRAVQESAIAPPVRLNPDVPQAVSDAVMRALERDPARRYADGHEMALALQHELFAHVRSAAEVDIASYLRTLFGGPEREEPVSAPAAPSIQSMELDPDDDPHAETVPRADLEMMRAPTARDRKARPAAPAPGEPPDLGPAPKGRKPRLSARAVTGVTAAVLVALVALLRAPHPKLARSDSKSPAAEMAAPAASTTPPATPVPAPGKAPEATATPARSAASPEPSALAPAAPIAARPGSPTAPAEPERKQPSPQRAEKASGASAAKLTERRPTAKRGSLQIVVRTWASVFLDGAKLGEGPKTFSVPAGPHTVRVINGEEGLDRARAVTVPPGQLVILDARQ